MFRSLLREPSPLSTPLLEDESDEPKSSASSQVSPSARSSRLGPISLLITLALNCVLLVAIVYVRAELSTMVPWEGTKQLYSPILDSLTHNRVVFTSLTGRTKYHGPPNDDVDREWEALYDMGISAIPGWQAELLPNKTTKIGGLDDKYIISLDVFHQLHCLNTLRKFQSPKRYPLVVEQRYGFEPGYGRFDHIDHCIQAIRESLMCAADQTLDPYVWPKDRQNARVSFESVHTCRNFGAIQQWARENQSPFRFSDAIKVHGSLVPVHVHETEGSKT